MSSPHTDESTAHLTAVLVNAWGCWGPTLTPDGSRVAYVSDRNGFPQLWVQDIRPGARPHPIALSDDPVLAVRWSADGQWLSCSVATNGGVRTQVWVVRPDGTGAQRVAGDPAQHAVLGPWTRSGHRLVVCLAPRDVAGNTRAVLIDPATGISSPLAQGELLTVLDLSVDERFVLLRDGKRGAQFCVLVDRDADEDYALLPYSDIGSTEVGLLRRAPAGDSEPMTAYLVTDAGRTRLELVAQSISADGTRGTAGVIASREDAELELLDSDGEGTLLVLGWNVAGESAVDLFDTAGGATRSVPIPSHTVVSGCALSRDGSRLVLCLEDPARPRQLWSIDTTTLQWQLIAGCEFTPPVPLVVPTLETFTAHDGLPLSGWLYQAPGLHEPGPALLSFHGGPESQERPVFSPQHQVIAAAGISVFAPNIRGSSGFGRAFVHADDRYGRNDAISDVETCVKHVVAQGVADPGRIAVSGRSYGGYLTLASLVFYPDLFAAGIDICGMSDLLTFYRDTEPWIASAAISKYGDPIRDKGLLREISPLTHVERIIAPLLVVHGQYDTNVPLNEATQLVAALRAINQPVEYLELAGEGHEYRRATSRIALIERMTFFLGRVL